MVKQSEFALRVRRVSLSEFAGYVTRQSRGGAGHCPAGCSSFAIWEGLGSMASSERKYILRTGDGEEYGPLDQENLTRWAQSGRVTAYCEIRSTLLPRWEYARDVSFLREIIAAQQAADDSGSTASLWDRIKRRMTLRATRGKITSGLQEPKVADYERAGIPVRLLSGISDLIVVGLIALGIYLLFALLVSNGFDPNAAFYTGVVVAYISILMYFTWSLHVTCQTVGHRIWGLILITSRGEEVPLGRAFLFAVGVLLFGLLTPFAMYILPSHCALQDVFSRTFVVKTKIVRMKT